MFSPLLRLDERGPETVSGRVEEDSASLRLTSAVRGTAARGRFGLNVKGYGVGGGPRRRALGADREETTGNQRKVGEDGVYECGPYTGRAGYGRQAGTRGRAARADRGRSGTAGTTRLTSAVLVTAARLRLCLN